MSIDPAVAIADIDDVLKTEIDYGGTSAVALINTLYMTCLDRWAPSGSTYRRLADEAQRGVKTEQKLHGIVSALRRDYERGMVKTFDQIVHAELFDDLLGQADHLLNDGGYTLPAAVIAGATMEEHLRKLATLNGISLQKADGKPKAASQLNDDLHKSSVFSQPQWRQVQVWIDLRNEAAHGKPEFAARTPKDVTQMISGVRDLLVKHPA